MQNIDPELAQNVKSGLQTISFCMQNLKFNVKNYQIRVKIFPIQGTKSSKQCHYKVYNKRDIFPAVPVHVLAQELPVPNLLLPLCTGDLYYVQLEFQLYQYSLDSLPPSPSPTTYRTI